MLLGWLHAFPVMITVGTVEGLLPKERWNTCLEGLYSLLCGQEAEAQVVLHS